MSAFANCLGFDLRSIYGLSKTAPLRIGPKPSAKAPATEASSPTATCCGALLCSCCLTRIVKSFFADPQPSTSLPSLENWSSVDVVLSHKQLEALFPSYPSEQVLDVVQFYTNQSLRRDGFIGAWAQILHTSSKDKSSDVVTMKISAPIGDVSVFAQRLTQFFAIGNQGLATWNAIKSGHDTKGINFGLDMGCSFTSFQTVQLLHYPPTESQTYSNFLYAPTVSRWDALLAQNGLPAELIPKQDRLLDIVPLVASGMGSGADSLKPFDQSFGDYTKALMKLYLVPPQGILGADRYTLPMIALGTPVSTWLWNTYQADIAPQLPVGRTGLEVLDLILLDVSQSGHLTPILIANHPAQYLYDTDVPLSEWNEPQGQYASPHTVMYQDLVAAGWNTGMALNNQQDPMRLLAAVKARWSDDELVKQVMVVQNMEYSWYMKGSHQCPARFVKA